MMSQTEKKLSVKAIIFDIGNVLVRWDPRLAYAPLFQGRTEELDYFLNEVCTSAWHSKHDQGIPFPENVGALQKEFPRYASMIALFESQWDNMFDGLIEGTVDLLYRLRETSCSLFALTNFPADKYADFYQRYDFMRLFLDVIVSGEEKVIKPTPRIYQILLERTAIVAEQSLFIDDRRENLIAAQKFGLQTYLFTDAPQLEAYLKDRGILSA